MSKCASNRAPRCGLAQMPIVSNVRFAQWRLMKSLAVFRFGELEYLEIQFDLDS